MRITHFAPLHIKVGGCDKSLSSKFLYTSLHQPAIFDELAEGKA